MHLSKALIGHAAWSYSVMNYLRWFWQIFEKLWQTSKAGPAPLEDRIPLATFLNSKSQIDKNRVASTAFMPRKATDGSGTWSLSTFRVDGLSNEAIWALALKHVVKKPRNLYGRGDVPAKIYRTQLLTLVPDNTPDRHINVTGWPDQSGSGAPKELHKEIALEIAKHAELIRCEPARLGGAS
jgi:hypothetical protein